jgi:hypothetical protein
MQSPSSSPKKVLSTARPRFVFQVMINPHAELGGASFGGCSAFVEVETEGATKAFRFGLAYGTARQLAEEIAQWAAVQAVQKDLPHGFEPACSASLLKGLPDGLRQRHPTAHTCQARTWLV